MSFDFNDCKNLQPANSAGAPTPNAFHAFIAKAAEGSISPDALISAISTDPESVEIIKREYEQYR